MGKYDELVERYERNCWPADNSIVVMTSGGIRTLTTAITTLEAELAAAQQQVKGALVMHDALSEKLENTQAELAAMKARGDRLAEALTNINRKASPDPERTMSEASNDLYWCACEARQALTEWRDQ